jgi:hypothetical protein
LLLILQQTEYPLKNGIPTSRGIENYVEDHAEDLLNEYQEFIRDTLHDVLIYATDFNTHYNYDSIELGRYYADEVIISTAELFIAYALNDLSKRKRRTIQESNKFVKATIFHELTHDYIDQIIKEARYIDKINVHDAYNSNFWIIHSSEFFGSTFIEEGICEYVTEKMGEIIPPKNVYIPTNRAALTDRDNAYLIHYKYASHVLKPYLDTVEFKTGVKTLLYNPPPTFEEILEPDLFFSRLLKYPAQ